MIKLKVVINTDVYVYEHQGNLMIFDTIGGALNAMLKQVDAKCQNIDDMLSLIKTNKIKGVGKVTREGQNEDIRVFIDTTRNEGNSSTNRVSSTTLTQPKSQIGKSVWFFVDENDVTLRYFCQTEEQLKDMMQYHFTNYGDKDFTTYSYYKYGINGPLNPSNQLEDLEMDFEKIDSNDSDNSNKTNDSNDDEADSLENSDSVEGDDKAEVNESNSEEPEEGDEPSDEY
jgi:hypothetical protein